MRVSRQDFTGRFDASRRTPQGGLKVPAYVTRTGVLTYRNPDGTVTRELRHPDDVFKEDSMASLAGAPVTIGHPGKVNPSNHAQHAVGHVGDGVERKDDRFVSTTLRIQDARAVEKVEKGDLLELSCGYDCDAVPEKGEYNGEKYDARQTNIVYNHVALLPKGGGRAGNDVRIRFDGLTEGASAGLSENSAKLSGTNMATELETKIAELTAEAAEQRSKKEKAKERADAAEKQVTDLTSQLEALRGEKAALESKLAQATDPARFDAAVDARVQLREDARSFGVEPSGTAREIMAACLAKIDTTFRADGLSDEYVRGRFEAEVRLTKEGQRSLGKARKHAQDAQDQGGEKDLIKEARMRAEQRSTNAWKGGN